MNYTKRSRRRFLTGTAAAVGSAFLLPEWITGRVLGLDGGVSPSNKINLGGIGIRNRGGHDLNQFLKRPDIRFRAICDIRRDQRETIKAVGDAANNDHDVAMYREMEDLLIRDDIDAVLIATGDRWHTLASITAARFGKDIYCEKPLSLTIEETLKLAEIVGTSGVVYQAGTQRRNVENFQIAADLALNGELGPLKEVHANTLWPSTLHEWFPTEALPPIDEIDWDRWLGPCPWRPYNRRYVDGQWRNHFDFHGGGILEWGSHTVDLCQWAAGKDRAIPVEYVPIFKPDGSISGTVEAIYADGLKLVMRESGWQGYGSCSARYVGEEGWVETGDSGNMGSSENLRKKIRTRTTDGDNAEHIAEFVRCVKTRQLTSANAQTAANAHIVCHCAYIAWQLGRTLKYDPAKNEFIGDVEANRMRSRPMRGPFTF